MGNVKVVIPNSALILIFLIPSHPDIQQLEVSDNELETVAKAVYDKLVDLQTNKKHENGSVVLFRCPPSFEAVDYIHAIRQSKNKYVLIGDQVLTSNQETHDQKKEHKLRDWMNNSFIKQFPSPSTLSFQAGCGIHHRPDRKMSEPLQVEKVGDQMVVAQYSLPSGPFITSIEKTQRLQMLEQLSLDILETPSTKVLEEIKRIEFVSETKFQAYDGLVRGSNPIRLTPGQEELIIQIISPLLSSKEPTDTVFLVDQQGNIHSEKGNGDLDTNLGCDLINNSITCSL